MDALLLKKELETTVRFQPHRKPKYNEVYGKLHLLAEKAQEDYVKKMNCSGKALSIICYKCYKKGHRKYECTNDWYCTIYKVTAHSACTCKRNKTKYDTINNSEKMNTESFVNAFIGISWLNEPSNMIFKIEDKIHYKNTLILDSGVS
eukprot:snap_masked-scaffold_103-processed-gene-0.23-mRNA-1 protein AED:1.00 eAED:1.00 QI:0/-1/0/0/-1/1/1/0/147